jgi:hypothetical protein
LSVTDPTALAAGESGIGKELVAIHSHSLLVDHPFIHDLPRRDPETGSRRMTMTRRVFPLTISLLMVASFAHAQATRTWVSGVGDDVNPCSRTAPCKTFAGAIPKTAANGEIDALDDGGFGAVTITKGIKIDGGGHHASILASGTNGVVINAGATDRIILRRIDINGTSNTSPGLRGIRFLAGAALYVENCRIENFSQAGIVLEGPGSLFVTDTTISDAAGGGIDIAPATGAALGTIDGVHVHASAFGIRATGGVTAMVRNSTVAGSAGDGFWSDLAPAQMSIDGSVATQNLRGVRASNGGIIRLSGVSIINNTIIGLLAETDGTIFSFRDNVIVANGQNGKLATKLPKH